MKRFVAIAGMALGWTTLATINLTVPIIGQSTHLNTYHWPGSATLLFGPTALIFTLIWLALFVVLYSAGGVGRWRVTVWGGLLASLPWLLVSATDRISRLPVWFRLPSSAFAAVLLVTLVVFWRPAFTPIFEKAELLGSRVLMLVAFVGAFCILDMAVLWWGARDLNGPRPLHQRSLTAKQVSGRGRVIWIIFDELSYEQVYGRRYPGLQLPAFDRLATQSTVFTNVVPAGKWTERVVPSLMTGVPVEDIRSTISGHVLLKASASAPWQPFQASNTVFQDALNLGYSTAIDGWVNPYCRMMPSVLDRCFWVSGEDAGNGATGDGTFRDNLWGGVVTLAGLGWGRSLLGHLGTLPSSSLVPPKDHVADYQNLLAQAESMLQDPSLNFVLLHLPVPHPEGIYNRRTGQFDSSRSTYIDNLALADRCLGQLQALLENAGQWDQATIVLMGDHSWRTSLEWKRRKSEWTKEEEAASGGGKFDTRPAYVVKLAGQRSGASIDTPFDAMKTRPLLDMLLTGAIKTPQELRDWVEAQAVRCPASSPACGQVKRAQVAR